VGLNSLQKSHGLWAIAAAPDRCERRNEDADMAVEEMVDEMQR
jgi:hypothetical protein